MADGCAGWAFLGFDDKERVAIRVFVVGVPTVVASLLSANLGPRNLDGTEMLTSTLGAQYNQTVEFSQSGSRLRFHNTLVPGFEGRNSASSSYSCSVISRLVMRVGTGALPSKILAPLGQVSFLMVRIHDSSALDYVRAKEHADFHFIFEWNGNQGLHVRFQNGL